MLAPAEIAAFYPDDYYGEPGVKFHPLVERAVRWIGARHVRFLSLGLAPGSRVLDVGCGRGVVLGALADRGLEVHGVEMSAAAARGADPRAQVRIAANLAEAGYPSSHFDQVLIWHVLEHVAHPRETLDEVRRILRPGGRLVVAVPNFASRQAEWSGAAWFHLDLPRHLYQLSARRAAPAARRDRLRADLRSPLLGAPEPVRLGAERAESRGVAAAQWALHAAAQPRATLPRRSICARARSCSPRSRCSCHGVIAASMWDAYRRTGATVHVVALRKPDPAR